MNIAIFAYSRTGCKTARRICMALPEAETLCYAVPRLAEPGFLPLEKAVYGAAFSEMDALIFVGAAGIAVREIAPYVRDKRTDPAVLGAPLTHDFAVISLSDRLTPWETIENRLRCAAEGNFAIAIYNPASHGRPDHLKRACDTLLRVLPEERLCGIVRNIGREGQSSRILTLGELQAADVDMFCTVFVGNSSTKVVNGALITPRGYRNV